MLVLTTVEKIVDERLAYINQDETDTSRGNLISTKSKHVMRRLNTYHEEINSLTNIRRINIFRSRFH